jgi:hypothetical protein
VEFIVKVHEKSHTIPCHDAARIRTDFCWHRKHRRGKENARPDISCHNAWKISQLLPAIPQCGYEQIVGLESIAEEKENARPDISCHDAGQISQLLPAIPLERQALQRKE